MFSRLSRWIIGRKKLNDDVKAALNAPRLHGVNLNIWQYLGRTIVKFTYTDIDSSDDANVFFFCKKGDNDARKFIVVPNSNMSYMQDKFMHHPWVVETASLWEVGERELYHIVNKEPSNWLKEYMLENHACVWSNQTHWWVDCDTAKFQSAKKSQSKKKPKIEDNIIKIDFNPEKQ